MGRVNESDIDSNWILEKCQLNPIRGQGTECGYRPSVNPYLLFEFGSCFNHLKL